MPIYEFRCDKCGRRFEKLCHTGEGGENLRCPDCGIAGPRRVMSTFRALGGGNGDEHRSGSGCASCNSSNCASCGH